MKKYPIDRWKALEKEYILAGFPRYKAHQKIAQEYSLSPTTIYRHIIPKAMEKHRKQMRKKYKHYQSTLKAKDRRRKYIKNYRQKTHVKNYNRKYDAIYKATIRSLDTYLLELFTDSVQITISQIIETVYKDTHIQMKPKTIRNNLKKYEIFFEIKPGIYELSKSSL